MRGVKWGVKTMVKTNEQSHATTILAGIAAGLAMNLAMLLTFRWIGFGINADGILLDPALQSEKLIAVWTEIEPLPLVVDRPLPIILGIVIFGVVHAYLYRWISPAWPTGVARRGLSFALIVFMMTFLFWEFFTPFNMFGEPLGLIALELSFWVVIALADGLVISAVMERGSSK